MEIKKLTTITAARAAVGTRISYTYSVLNDGGEILRQNVRGNLILTKGMEDAIAAVKTMEDFLTTKLPEGDRNGTLKSFCLFQSTTGEMVTYIYDEIDKTGAIATKNNQATVTLVEGYMDDQIAAATALRAFLKEKL